LTSLATEEAMDFIKNNIIMNNQLAYIALLRGINVSGQKLIKMEKLRDCIKGLGFRL